MVDVIGMFALGTGGTENAIAMIDIPFDGFIIGVDWDSTADLDADLEFFEAELSFIATNQLRTSDIRGRISSISMHVTVLTAVGGHVTAVNKWIGGFDIAVAGGERMFLHIVGSTNLSSVTRCNVFLDQPGSARRSARRR